MGASRPTTFEFSYLGVGQLCSQKKITNVAAVAYRVLDQWRLFYKLYPIFMHFLLINACSACKCNQCFSIL